MTRKSPQIVITVKHDRAYGGRIDFSFLCGTNFHFHFFFIHALTAKTTLQTKAYAVSIDAFGCKDVPFGGLIGNLSILVEVGAENFHF